MAMLHDRRFLTRHTRVCVIIVDGQDRLTYLSVIVSRILELLREAQAIVSSAYGKVYAAYPSEVQNTA